MNGHVWRSAHVVVALDAVRAAISRLSRIGTNTGEYLQVMIFYLLINAYLDASRIRGAIRQSGYPGVITGKIRWRLLETCASVYNIRRGKIGVFW